MSMKMAKRERAQAGQQLFIDTLEQIEPLALSLHKKQGRRTCRRLAVRRWHPMSDAQMASTCPGFESRTLISNGHKVNRHTVKGYVRCSDKTHQTLSLTLDATQRGLETLGGMSDATHLSV